MCKTIRGTQVIADVFPREDGTAVVKYYTAFKYLGEATVPADTADVHNYVWAHAPKIPESAKW